MTRVCCVVVTHNPTLYSLHFSSTFCYLVGYSNSSLSDLAPVFEMSSTVPTDVFLGLPATLGKITHVNVTTDYLIVHRRNHFYITHVLLNNFCI